MIGVFEDDDLIDPLPFGSAFGVGVSFGDPESSSVVKGHGDRLVDLGFPCGELDVKAFGYGHVGGGFDAREILFEFAARFRPGGFVGDSIELFLLVAQDMATEHTADDDIGRLISIDVCNDDLTTDSGRVVG